jgi:DNA polymerase-3 subunit epsilon
MKDFIAIDFETASELRTTPVSIGIVFVENGKIREEKSFSSLLNPGTRLFNPIAVKQHGIRYDDVKESPSFVEIWNSVLRNACKENCVAMHSTSTHFSVITKCVELYQLEKFPIKYLSTMSVAKAIQIPIEKVSLGNLCEYFEIKYSDKHNSIEDALVTAEVVLRLSEIVDLKHYIKTAFETERKTNFRYLNQDEVVDKYEISLNDFNRIEFNGKKIVVFGEINRCKTLLERGAILQEKIDRDTDFVIDFFSMSNSDYTLIEQLNTNLLSNVKIIPGYFVI